MPSRKSLNDQGDIPPSPLLALIIQQEREKTQRIALLGAITAARRAENDQIATAVALRGNEEPFLRFLQKGPSLATPFHQVLEARNNMFQQNTQNNLAIQLFNATQSQRGMPGTMLDNSTMQRNMMLQLLHLSSQQSIPSSVSASSGSGSFQSDRTIATDSIVTEAYERGRQEAVFSLLQSGMVNPAAAMAFSKNLGTAQAVTMLETLDTHSVERRQKNQPYFDASALKDPDAVSLSLRRTRGGVTEPFPEKLHRMLRDAEASGKSECISFFEHGRAFGIHNHPRFCREIMPKYFKQSRLSSFQRQLNLYGFSRITTGPDSGGYFHEMFLKGRPALAIHMRRVGVPKAPTERTLLRSAIPKADAPDFYNMDPIQKLKPLPEQGNGGSAA